MYAVYHGPEGLTAIATPHPPLRRRPRGRAARGRRRGRARASSSTPSWRRVPGRAADVVVAAADLAGRPPAAGRRRPRRASPATSARRARPVATVLTGVRRRGRRRWSTSTSAPRTRCPSELLRAHARSSRTRSSTRHRSRDRDAALPAPALGPRLRARPRHDPARLLHDEAQRDHRDGADQPARLRRPAPVRAGRGRRRATASWSTDLERWLAEVTGYDAVSIQPNAGSQGELAGLLAIRGYHRRATATRARDVCLIPSLRPRHQRRVRGDGRHAGRRGQGRRRRRRSTWTTCARSARSTPTTWPRSW